MNVTVVPYEEKYNDSLLRMEKGITQGKSVELEITKASFLDRAKVFQNYRALIALTSDGSPMATCAGAQTKMRINEVNYDVGFGFEAKVSPAMRGKGIGKVMATALYNLFFRPEGLTKVFTTIKRGNLAIAALLTKAIPNTWFYEFVYLTIPCSQRLRQGMVDRNHGQQLGVTLFAEDTIDRSFFGYKGKGLGYFKTFKMYQLKIRHLSWLWRIAFWLDSKLRLSKDLPSPAVGEPIRFATLFNHTPDNIMEINEVLEELSNNAVHFLMVCCRRNDSIFKTLKGISVNTYPHYLVTDFHLSKKDSVTLDVRCL